MLVSVRYLDNQDGETVRSRSMKDFRILSKVAKWREELEYRRREEAHSYFRYVGSTVPFFLREGRVRDCGTLS